MSYVDWSHVPRKELPARPRSMAGSFLAYAAGAGLLAVIASAAVVLHYTGDQARNGIDLTGP